jgi:hypothetical protein
MPIRYRRSSYFALISQVFSLYQPKEFARIKWSCFWETCETNVMAKKSVNKSALVRNYLTKYPEKGPSAIAKQIADEHKVMVTGKFVATVKTKVKQASSSAAVASPSAGSAVALSVPKSAKPAPARKKPAVAKVKPTSAKPAPASASAAGLSQHIANLKAAAQRLGKDEAKRIIDLF